jgi:hypothetical protein
MMSASCFIVHPMYLLLVPLQCHAALHFPADNAAAAAVLAAAAVQLEKPVPATSCFLCPEVVCSLRDCYDTHAQQHCGTQPALRVSVWGAGWVAALHPQIHLIVVMCVCLY